MIIAIELGKAFGLGVCCIGIYGKTFLHEIGGESYAAVMLMHWRHCS